MESDTFYPVIAKRLKSVEKYLSGFKKEMATEHLHKIRICIKKLRAILSFVENFNAVKFETDFLKLLFDKAGRIREIHINMAILNRIPVPPHNLVLQLKMKEKTLLQKFIKDIPKNLLLLRNFHKETYFCYSLPHKKALNKYFIRKSKKAVNNFNKHERTPMHHFRKSIKKMMYVYELIPKKLKSKIELNKVLINKIQKEVGSWHDTYSTISFLSQKKFTQKAKYISFLKLKEDKQFNTLFIKNPNLKF